MKKDHAPGGVWSLVVKQKSAGPLERVSAGASATTQKGEVAASCWNRGLRHKAQAVGMEPTAFIVARRPEFEKG